MKRVRAAAVRLALLILVTVGLFGCDYATKSAAKATLEGTDGIPVAPAVLHGAVELRYVENEDIAFSALRHLGVPRSPELLIALSAIALSIIVGMVLVARRRVARGHAAASEGRDRDGRSKVAAAKTEPEPGDLASRAQKGDVHGTIITACRCFAGAVARFA